MSTCDDGWELRAVQNALPDGRFLFPCGWGSSSDVYKCWPTWQAVLSTWYLFTLSNACGEVVLSSVHPFMVNIERPRSEELKTTYNETPIDMLQPYAYSIAPSFFSNHL